MSEVPLYLRLTMPRGARPMEWRVPPSDGLITLHSPEGDCVRERARERARQRKCVCVCVCERDIQRAR